MGVGWFLSLFYFFGGDGTDRAGLGGDYMPRRYTPAHFSDPERLHSTGSRAGRARTRAGKYQSRPRHAQTLDTLHRSAPDTRQAAPGRSGRCRGGWAACDPSIMRIMIALSQAWYIDSRLYKYHTNILLHLVIVNYYLSIDIPSY